MCLQNFYGVTGSWDAAVPETVWCNHFSQCSSHKGVRGQFVTETGADMNSHLKGQNEAEVTFTGCIMDLSFKSYIYFKNLCMTEFESQRVNVNCNAQWTASDIKKIYR